MCAIFGSFSKEKLKELHRLNSYRGELSYSLSVLRSSKDGCEVVSRIRGAGKIPEDTINSLLLEEGDYILGHTQAPTTEDTNIHPASVNGVDLWHNGIIKAHQVVSAGWDTKWLLEKIITEGVGVLSEIDGTFACVMYKTPNLYLFRNEISPLFFDNELNLSSTKFSGAIPLPANIVFDVNIASRAIKEIASFTTFHNPYFFV